MTNKPFNPAPPKVDKNFIPDQTKLEKIRESIPEPPTAPTPVVNFDDEVVRDLEDEDVHKLTNIISGEETFESPSYIYDETAEVKCKKYAELYPNINTHHVITRVQVESRKVEIYRKLSKFDKNER